MTCKLPLMKLIRGFLKRSLMVTVMSDDIVAYRLLKAANLSSYHEELVKTTIPDLHFDIMKDRLKKIFSDAWRQIPTKSEDIIKVKEAFMAEEINHLFFQDSYHQNELPLENEYNPFRDTPNHPLLPLTKLNKI